MQLCLSIREPDMSVFEQSCGIEELTYKEVTHQKGIVKSIDFHIVLYHFFYSLYNIPVVTLGILLHPLSSIFRLQTLSALATHLDQGKDCPWYLKAPQKIIGAIPCPKRWIDRPVVCDQPLVAHDMGKRVSQHYFFQGCGSFPIRPGGSKSNPNTGSLPRPSYPKAFIGS